MHPKAHSGFQLRQKGIQHLNSFQPKQPPRAVFKRRSNCKQLSKTGIWRQAHLGGKSNVELGLLWQHRTALQMRRHLLCRPLLHLSQHHWRTTRNSLSAKHGWLRKQPLWHIHNGLHHERNPSSFSIYSPLCLVRTQVQSPKGSWETSSSLLIQPSSFINSGNRERCCTRRHQTHWVCWTRRNSWKQHGHQGERKQEFIYLILNNIIFVS